MIQCAECEFADVGPDGSVRVRCNPLVNVKEAECLAKWQLMRLEALVQAYNVTLSQHRRLAPLQEKMMKFMEREIEEVDEADSWKLNYDDEDEDENPGGEGQDDNDPERPFI